MNDTVTLPCVRCAKPVEVLRVIQQWGSLCDGCIADDNRVINTASRAQLLSAEWDSMCPMLFRDTDFNKLPLKSQSKLALDWDDPRRGLNLWGDPRTGKTRTLYVILHREHMMGKRIKIFSPSAFAHGCEAREWKTAGWIRQLIRDYDIIAFDDIDKCKLTKAQEEKFFAVLDGRMTGRKPVFFTGNSHGDKLQTLFYNGAAIIARIRECCKSICFPKPKL